MKGPEDDAGLAGKVALISGGGAVGIGNGRAAAILLARAQRAKASLLKTEGTGWDVGHSVKFLLSNFSRYINGQLLVVDGGVTLQAPERESQEH
ncbi:SDR family oxidoreductase [Bradyrhizobium sp. 1]|uniref:SDR family oxidoreductase n=1 Tax=Bradyrhizobium sp. 1 TaxID=241591 RepID=UPI001FF90F12|nr:SDR family oxidoreductase [Bradyrhizobium sp. 1]